MRFSKIDGCYREARLNGLTGLQCYSSKIQTGFFSLLVVNLPIAVVMAITKSDFFSKVEIQCLLKVQVCFTLVKKSNTKLRNVNRNYGICQIPSISHRQAGCINFVLAY